MTNQVDIPEEELLLPWYVSGQLTPEERAQVDKALSTSPSLRRALEEERRLQVAVATAPLPEPSAIDPDTLLGRAAAAVSPLPGWLKPALAAAVLLALVEGAALAWLASPAAIYRTASAPTSKIVVEQTRYAVQFVEDASVAAVRAALAEAELGIVRGPLPDGAYILESAQGDQAYDRLKRSGVIRTIARTD